jgi:hypothetical protein
MNFQHQDLTEDCCREMDMRPFGVNCGFPKDKRVELINNMVPLPSYN